MRKISSMIKFHRYGSASLLGAGRRTRGPVHAIAFGIGLAIWFLLLRNTVSPHPASIRALANATHRSADALRCAAVAPKLTVTIIGPQDLRPMATPRGETNGSVRLVADNTFEQMLALVVREPQRPMAMPRGETNGSVRLVADNTFEQMLALVVREPQRPMPTPRGETNGGIRPVPHIYADSAHASKTRAHKTPARPALSLRASGQRIQARPNGTASTLARRWAPSFTNTNTKTSPAKTSPTNTKTSPTAADQKLLFQRFSARSLSDSHSREPR
jgi:hypothetical protein